MKRLQARDDQDRFKGSLRHYHRTSPRTQRTWDEWINGKPPKYGDKYSNKKWMNILIIVSAVLALGGIIAGLIIELR